MNADVALAMLENAIYNVSFNYIKFGSDYKSEHVERCFAYELYHQWRKLLDIYKESHPENKKLYLNGEIPKCYGPSGNGFPDMVLHSGQDNQDEQILACEIKRHNNKDGILKDLAKLIKYLDLCIKGDQEKPAHYEKSVFIMIGTNVEEMSKIIKEALDESKLEESTTEGATSDESKEKKKKKLKEKKEDIATVKNSNKLQLVICLAVEENNPNTSNGEKTELKIEKRTLEEIING